jgi:hypothetical protein
MRQQASESSSLLAILMLALLTVGIVTVLMSFQAVQTVVLGDLMAMVQRSAPTRPTDGAMPPERAARLALKEASSVVPAETADSASGTTVLMAQAAAEAPVNAGFAVGQRARIAHTDGQGVVLHASPSQSSRRPAGLLEGTAVTVLERSGNEWVRVQSDSKQAGWISTEYLAGE